jgi:hypothetical protein
MNKISSSLLQDLFQRLRTINTDSECSAPDLDETIVDRGWLFRYELEDLLLLTDGRTSHIDVEALIRYFELPMRYIFSRPRFLSADSMGHKGLAMSDAAFLFIQMENMGFDSQPIRLIKPVLAKLGQLPHVTDSEWTILTYTKRQDRECFEIKSDAPMNDDEFHRITKKDVRGRRFEFASFGSDPYSLTVKGSKYKTPVPRIWTTCEICGHSYTKGDPESALTHRSEHARINRLVNPRPLGQFSARLLSHTNPELVNSQSPLWMHKEIHSRSKLFRREMQFDFTQWEGSQTSKNMSPESQGFLFADHTDQNVPGTAVGACAFWRDLDKWRLRWVWVCPKMRQAGVLTHRWAKFINLYGDFEIELPLSDAMRAFVLKHGTRKQVAAITRR